MKLTVGVTGGTGFIGKRLVAKLIEEGFNVVSLQRSNEKIDTVESRYFDLASTDSISEDLLSDIDVIVHTAALVHDTLANQSQHNELNYQATKALFNLSKVVGVKKFIFLSTVGVYGVSSYASPIDVNTPTNPQTAYAKSKLKSELELLADTESKITVSAIRLPLVCGENAPGNFGFLEKISKSKLPLPFGVTENKRSIISVELAVKVLTDAAKNQDSYKGLQLLAEVPSVSTKELVVQLRSSYGMLPNLIPMPKILMKLLLTIIRKKKVYEQLYEDLVFISSINTDKYY